MNQLKVVSLSGQLVTESRDVAEMTGKEHKELLRSIRQYIGVLTSANLRSSDFFIPHYYEDAKKEQRPCFLLTKKGCDMVANKMTGEKGVLFTAAYVSKFEEMQKQLEHTQPKTQLEILQGAINQMVLQEKEIQQIKQENQTLKHRIDNLDRIDTIGDHQQRFNKMIKRYAWDNGLNVGTAWKHFDQAFNTAFRTNLTARRNNYAEKHGFKNLSRPQYLSLVNQLEDAIRVADKMINQSKRQVI